MVDKRIRKIVQIGFLSNTFLKSFSDNWPAWATSLYIIDDMLPQPNWPEGHHEKAINLVIELEKRSDLVLTKQNWATGIIIAVKK